jgi:hypothetical protein
MEIWLWAFVMNGLERATSENVKLTLGGPRTKKY